MKNILFYHPQLTQCAALSLFDHYCEIWTPCGLTHRPVRPGGLHSPQKRPLPEQLPPSDHTELWSRCWPSRRTPAGWSSWRCVKCQPWTHPGPATGSRRIRVWCGNQSALTYKNNPKGWSSLQNKSTCLSDWKDKEKSTEWGQMFKKMMSPTNWTQLTRDVFIVQRYLLDQCIILKDRTSSNR